MKFNCYGTGSKGNFYILKSNNGDELVLELGIKYDSIITKINFKKTKAILISHNHSDHNNNHNDQKFQNLGIPIITVDNAILNKKETYGAFTVVPLTAYHNVPCVSYLIRVDGKTILFATDTNKITHVSCKIDYMICEVNHSQSRIINLTMYDEDNEYYHLTKSFKNHHSLEEMEFYLQCLKYKPKKLFIIHYSTTKAFNEKETIETLTPYIKEPIVIVRKDEEYEF